MKMPSAPIQLNQRLTPSGPSTWHHYKLLRKDALCSETPGHNTPGCELVPSPV